MDSELMEANHDAAPMAAYVGQTPEQSRNSAVATLVTAAMAGAGRLQLTPEESAALLKEFPDSDFQPGAGGNAKLIYIEHAALRDRMNGVLGMGQWAIIVRETWKEDIRTSSGTAARVYARVMLIVRGSYVGEAVGNMTYYPNNNSQNYGDAFEGAKTAAFRRCAKEFGIGLQAWKKDWCLGWWARKSGAQQRTPLDTRKPAAHQAPKAAPVPQYEDRVQDSPEPGSFDGPDLTPPDGMFGPETPADTMDLAAQPFGPVVWEGTIKMAKAAVGKGPGKLFADDGKTIFDLWSKNKAACNTFKAAWDPPSNKKAFRIDAMKKQSGPNGEFTNYEVLDIQAL